jgi:hypothetical protein
MKALTESIRHSETDAKAVDILLENLSGSPYIPEEQKNAFAALALSHDFAALRLALRCPPRDSTSAAVSKLSEGQMVKVRCDSQQSWEDGEVVQKIYPSELYLRIRYGDPPREELLDQAQVARKVRADPVAKSFRTFRDMVVAVFTRSRKIAALPPERRRMLGSAMLAQASIESLNALAIMTLETSHAFHGPERDLVANDIFDNRFDRLLLPDRFDCDEVLRSGHVVPPALTPVAETPAAETEGLRALADAEPVPEDCAVCLGPLTTETARLPCEHTFCQVCIVGWAAREPSCPLCRSPFDPRSLQSGLC